MNDQTQRDGLGEIKVLFKKLFHADALFIARAPGRAEIIGNHTDYNQGFALGAAITHGILVAVSHREDDMIPVYSDEFEAEPITFSLDEIHKRNDNHWTNYIKGVVSELAKKYAIFYGFNMAITSDVPSCGGVSSSAALELAVALSLTQLYRMRIKPLDLALLCQQAENGPLVQTPCGFLDQATSGLSKKNNLTFLDFLPKNGYPVSKISYIPARFDKHGVSFIIVVDRKVKRNLGESGYPERRKMCEESLPILSKLLQRTIHSLRDVSIQDFKKCQDMLNKANSTMRMRVEHVVYENQRVIDAIIALKKDNFQSFGRLLTESGKSALELYELDAGTPELSFLLQHARIMDGVVGARNMGGGFSANILVLIKNSVIHSFTDKLQFAYNKKYHNILDFIPFQPSQGAEIC